MNILIMGDSWGVPNYDGDPNSFFEYHHTEFLLRNLGYNVYNCSLAGGSNLEVLARAKKYLSGEEIKHPASPHSCNPEKFKNLTIKLESTPLTVDWILWFHTELARDFNADLVRSNKTNINTQLVAHITYSRFFEFQRSMGVPMIVVGGAAPVHPIMYEYGTPVLCIDDWRSDILGKQLPHVQTLSRLDVVDENAIDSKADKYDILINHSLIQKLVEESLDFPDNSHPGQKPHRELTEQIDKFIKAQTA
jgi:hypothetical protein